MRAWRSAIPISFRLGSSILMQARRHDRPMPFTAPSWARAFSREDLDLRLYATPGEEVLPHAINAGLEPTEIPGNPHAMRAIQQRLLCDDCYLIGRLDEDEGDRAPSARITTSSETDDGADRNVASGQTRSVHGERGAPPDRAHPGSHRWMSSPEHGMPASIELHWDVPVPIRELRLVFETGMHRHLTLSHSDRYTHMMHWGRPQEETVRDYAVEGRCESGWRCLFEVSGNYQRRRVHRLEEPATASSLRVTVNATNGVGQARICEVRVY